MIGNGAGKPLSATIAAAASLCAQALAADSYDVRIANAPSGLRDEFARVSTLAAGKREFATSAALRRMAERDATAIGRALQAAGYYAGKVDVQIDQESDPEKPTVIFSIEPGSLFAIAEYIIIYRDEADGRPTTLAEAEVEANGEADGASLQAAQLAFLNALWDKGYPAAKIVGRRAEADLKNGTAKAVFTFESGPKATFGEIRISGADETAPVFIEKLRTWEPGEQFERSKLVSYRDKLAATGLFGGIEVEPGPPGPDGAAPVLVTLEERKRRTIGAGLSYSTSEGPGGRLFFEYRNLFHRGERARIDLEASQVEQGMKFDFNKPLPRFPGSGFASLEFKNETTDAFHARTVGIGAGLSRFWLDDRLETRGGASFETSNVRTAMSEERTYYFSLPLSATWNTEDDLLNPTKGVRATLAVTPYTGSDHFTLTELNARTRLKFGEDDRFTAAFRGRLGGTLGSSLLDLPSNKRFYAGGGASVRGYGFQFAGPLDANDNPIGGRSVVEGAFEARAMVVGNFEAAAFIDAGSISANALPDFTNDFFVGVGTGVRYHTAVGPIRIDVAVPLEKRDADRGWQLYISLGQPF